MMCYFCVHCTNFTFFMSMAFYLHLYWQWLHCAGVVLAVLMHPISSSLRIMSEYSHSILLYSVEQELEAINAE